MNFLKKITLSIFWFLTIVSAEAQVKIHLSPKLNTITGSFSSSFKDVNNNIILPGTKGRYNKFKYKEDVIFEKIGDGDEHTTSDPVKLEADGNELNFERTIYFNNSIYTFGTYRDKKEDICKLYSIKFDPESYQPIGSPKEILSLKCKNMPEFNFTLSHNKSKLAIISSRKDDKMEDGNDFNINVFQGDLNEIWNKRVKPENGNTTYYPAVDNNGNVFYLAEIKTEEKTKLLKKEYFIQYELISYVDNGSTIKKNELKLTQNYISDVTYRVLDDGNIVCGGFYNTDNKGGCNGFFFFNLDPATGSITKENYRKFSTKELTAFMSGWKAEKGAAINCMSLGNILINAKGGYVLVGELYYLKVVEYYNTRTGQTTYKYTYTYNSLMVANTNSDLNIVWLSIVPKKQITSNDYGRLSSYAMMIKGDNIYILFNDHPDNLAKLKSDESLTNFNYKKNYICLITMTPDGKFKKSAPFKSDYEGLMLKAKDCKQISDSELLVFGTFRKGGYQIGWLTF